MDGITNRKENPARLKPTERLCRERNEGIIAAAVLAVPLNYDPILLHSTTENAANMKLPMCMSLLLVILNAPRGFAVVVDTVHAPEDASGGSGSL